MSEPWRCPTCKQLWEDDEIVDGLCPGCLMGDCLDEQRRQAGNGWENGWEPPPVEELQPLFADYEIEALVGRGGMGAVYRAIQKKLNRQVAIKILPPALGWNPASKDRFVREALTLAKLHHPGFVTIHDSGQSQDLCYLVMEYVDGQTLREYALENRLSARQVLELGSRLCRTMEVAHAAGIIHRDLKLENILVASWEEVKIADFGVAKLFGESAGDDGGAIFASCRAAGTRAFMAPEQMTNPGQVDQRADIYSLGVILYLLLTGGLPAAEPVPPCQVLPELDPRVDALILRALATDPANRHQSMLELRRDLETILAPAGAGNSAGWKRGWQIAAAGLVLFLVMGFAFWKGPWEQRSFGLAPGRLPAATQSFVVALDNTTRLAMQPIPAGEFEMGSPPNEGPQRSPSEQARQVQITKSFWMGKYEVTQAQYQALMGTNPAFCKQNGLEAPVEHIAWTDAVRFCEVLNGWEQKAGRIPPGYLYRLPTEAEWEYAAREGGKSRVVIGEAEMNALGWNAVNSEKKPHPVGLKSANGWGLHDLFGNVSEWCLDAWNDRPGEVAVAADPVWRPGADGFQKIHRGGHCSAQFFRSAWRDRLVSTAASPFVGFRVVLAPVIKPVLPVYHRVELPLLMAGPPASGKGFSLQLAQAINLEMLPVAAGEFIMGSPADEQWRHPSERQHPVQITSPFWMGRCEVTQGQYKAVMGYNPAIFQDAGWDAPVENISWHGAMAFCKQLTEQEKARGHLPGNLVYRLPTCAEWEYACRAGGKTPSAIYAREEMNELGWNSANSQRTTHPVGRKLPNAWGFHDMFGNVSEWCLDCANEKPSFSGRAVDPLELAGRKDMRARRGGGLCDHYRCAMWAGIESRARDNGTGFRVVLAPPREAEDPEPAMDAETRKLLDELPRDEKGFRKLLTTDWWQGFRPKSSEEGIKVLTPGGPFMPSSCALTLRRFIDASQETEFSLTWKVGGTPGPAQDEVTKNNATEIVIRLEPKDGLPLAQARMILNKPLDGLVAIKPETWYRSTLAVTGGINAKFRVSLFGKTDAGEILLKQWEYPVAEADREMLRHVRLILEIKGNVKTLSEPWIFCSDALIWQGGKMEECMR